MALKITEGVLRLRDQATGVLKRFRKQMTITGKTTEQRASRMIRAFTAFRGSLTGSLGAIISLKGAIIGAGFGFFAKSVLDAANTIEQATARLVGIKGGLDAATESMAFFQEVAAGVPFTLEEVVEAGVSLEAFGARSEDTLRAVADLAGFMGVTIPEAARAFGRAFAGGAGAADVLRERGVLALVKMKAGVDDLKDLSLPGFRKALLASMVAPLGPIAGAAKRLASTWKGQISIMADAMFRLKTAIAEAGVLDFSKNVVRELTASIQGLEQAFFGANTEIEKTTDTAAKFTGVAELILLTFVTLEATAVAVAFAIVGIASAITVLILILPKLIFELAGFDDAAGRIQNTFRGFRDTLSALGETMTEDIPAQFGRGRAAINAFREAQEKLRDATEDTNNQLEKQNGLTAKLAERTKALVGLTEIEAAQLVGLVLRIEQVRKGRLRSAEAEAAISRQRIRDLTDLIGGLEFGAEQADELGKRLALALKEIPEEAFTKRVLTMIEVWQIFAEEVKKANDKIEASNKKTADAMQVMADRVAGLLKGSGEGTQAFLTSLAASFNVNSAAQFGSILENIGDFRRELIANNASAEQQEAATWATRGAFVAAGLSTIRSLLETFGGESLAIQKAFAVADIIVNTSVAIMRALAELGPIAGPVAAALMAAMGAAQIAAVLAARPGGARGAVSVGGGGGGPAGAPAAPPPEVMARPPSVVNISIQGFVGDEATLGAELHRLLREAEGDGVQVNVL